MRQQIKELKEQITGQQSAIDHLKACLVNAKNEVLQAKQELNEIHEIRSRIKYLIDERDELRTERNQFRDALFILIEKMHG